MSKLIYITNTSLDGYVEDETGAFDWVNPDQVLELLETRRFGTGVIHLRYRMRGQRRD